MRIYCVLMLSVLVGFSEVSLAWPVAVKGESDDGVIATGTQTAPEIRVNWCARNAPGNDDCYSKDEKKPPTRRVNLADVKTTVVVTNFNFLNHDLVFSAEKRTVEGTPELLAALKAIPGFQAIAVSAYNEAAYQAMVHSSQILANGSPEKSDERKKALNAYLSEFSEFRKQYDKAASEFEAASDALEVGYLKSLTAYPHAAISEAQIEDMETGAVALKTSLSELRTRLTAMQQASALPIQYAKEAVKEEPPPAIRAIITVGGQSIEQEVAKAEKAVAQHAAIVAQINAAAQKTRRGAKFVMERQGPGQLISYSLEPKARVFDPELQDKIDAATPQLGREGKPGQSDPYVSSFQVPPRLPIFFHLGFVHTWLDDITYRGVPGVGSGGSFERVRDEATRQEVALFVSYFLKPEGTLPAMAVTLGTDFDDPGDRYYIGGSVQIAGGLTLNMGVATQQQETGRDPFTDDRGQMFFDRTTEDRKWSGFVGLSFKLY